MVYCLQNILVCSTKVSQSIVDSVALIFVVLLYSKRTNWCWCDKIIYSYIYIYSLIDLLAFRYLRKESIWGVPMIFNFALLPDFRLQAVLTTIIVLAIHLRFKGILQTTLAIICGTQLVYFRQKYMDSRWIADRLLDICISQQKPQSHLSKKPLKTLNIYSRVNC